MRTRKYPGASFLLAAIALYGFAGVAVILLAFERGLLRNGEFWNGVIGNGIAALIQLLVLSAMAGIAFNAFQERKWNYTRNLAYVRLLNSFSKAWTAVAGAYDIDRAIYHFGGIPTDSSPDFQALSKASEILNRDKIGQERARAARYIDTIQAELMHISEQLSAEVRALENTLDIFGGHCGPKVWAITLRGLDEIKKFQMFLSNRKAADLILPTAVVLDSLVEAGALLTRNVPKESPDDNIRRLLSEAERSADKLQKRIARIKRRS
jgi:hypothetical protein